MQLRGKIIAGIAGIFIGDLLGIPMGGLVGFVAGSLIGHYFFDAPDEKEQEANDYQDYRRQQGRFIFHVMALSAKVAKADGPVNRNELNHMERLMRQQFRLNDKGRSDAVRIWNNAKESDESFERYATAFYEAFAKERYQINNMMDLLFSIAAADGGLHPREEEVLLRAAHIFRISRMQYDRIKMRFYNIPPPRKTTYSTLDPYYTLLGVKPSDPPEVIKNKYRTLAMKWHPDRQVADGASPETLRHAKEKFQQINEAYERITESKGPVKK
jgi:DnaJ like chaperone protein